VAISAFRAPPLPPPRFFATLKNDKRADEIATLLMFHTMTYAAYAIILQAPPKHREGYDHVDVH